MSRKANPYDNAWMESAIGKLKGEVLADQIPADRQAARLQLLEGIECWYNQRRDTALWAINPQLLLSPSS